MNVPATIAPRPLRAIAREILSIWGSNPAAYAARPYLVAMTTLDTVRDSYGYDSGDSIVRYALSNMTGFRGEDARRLKAELKAHLKR